MNIDKVNRLNSISKPAGRGPVGKTSAARGKDTVSLSPEALRSAEMEKYREIAKAAPDIRMDRINEVKAKINDPAYYNDETLLKGLADKIAGSMGV